MCIGAINAIYAIFAILVLFGLSRSKVEVTFSAKVLKDLLLLLMLFWL